MKQMRSRILLVAALLSIVLPASQSFAATAVVKDGSALQIGNVIFQLSEIDAPTIDQLCIDEHADVWTCGIAARDQLSKLIEGKQVYCNDHGEHPTYKKRRVGTCRVEGDATSLSELMLRAGFAVIDDAAPKNYQKEQSHADLERLGLWKGCFVTPLEFRNGQKDGRLLGAACRADRDREIREAIFPEDRAMPPGCNIKGKFAVRARVTGNRGIYHLQGCRSYPGQTKPDRWFCSEEDAQANGFRRAYNCRSPSKSK
jgi:endonuclease YncB( thermonuclease family)